MEYEVSPEGLVVGDLYRGEYGGVMCYTVSRAIRCLGVWLTAL